MQPALDSGDQPILNIVGQKVALGPHRRDLLPVYHRWINDFEVTRMLDIGLRPATLESEEAWYERIRGTDTEVVFLIYELQSLRPIGSTGLHRIDHKNRTAEYGIFIGEKDCWGKGYGTEVTTLMLDYGFSVLDLHNIMLRVFDYNERAMRVYARAGFRPIGRWRQALRRGGQAHDVVLMDCLSSEFQSPVLKRLLGDADG